MLIELQFHKASALQVNDIEDAMGVYFNDKYEPKVRQFIGQERAKSFSMRHPVLTGIATFGIAPAVANERAKDNVVRSIVRNDTAMRSALNTHLEKLHERQREVNEYNLKMEKARAIPNAAAALGSSYVAGKYIDNNRY